MPTATKTEDAPAAGLELYRVRDELAHSFNPANALERMLITQMAQSWLRLQRAQAAEARYFETRGVLEAIANEFDRYKAITRYVADCERAWRQAMLHLEKAQRRRTQTDRSSPNARRRLSQEPAANAKPVIPAIARFEQQAGKAPPAVSTAGRPESSSRAG